MGFGGDGGIGGADGVCGGDGAVELGLTLLSCLTGTAGESMLAVFAGIGGGRGGTECAGIGGLLATDEMAIGAGGAGGVGCGRGC